MMKSKLCIFLILNIILLQSCGNKVEETVIYLVRHAEKDLKDTTDNPSLTKEGEERANKLVKEFKDVELNRIYSTKFDRNMKTVQPLAKEKNLEIQIYGWYEWTPMLDEIKKLSGKSFLICGHGDNLLPMIEYLGGEKPIDELGKHEYGKIFKVVLSEDDVQVEMSTY